MRISTGICVIVACLAVVGGCSHRPDVPAGYVRNAPPDAGFSCVVPGQWRALERHSGALVAFYGPPTGPAAYSADISIYYYSPKDFSSIPNYYARETASSTGAEPLRKEKIGANDGYFFSTEYHSPGFYSKDGEQLEEEDYLITSGAGFYALVYLVSWNDADKSLPVFKLLAKSFRIH